MTAYVVVIRNNTKDASAMEPYRQLAVKAPMDKLKILARGDFEVLEGDPAESVIVIGFPTKADALEWYRSDEYQAAAKHRLASGDYRTVLVEGS